MHTQHVYLCLATVHITCDWTLEVTCVHMSLCSILWGVCLHLCMGAHVRLGVYTTSTWKCAYLCAYGVCVLCSRPDAAWSTGVQPPCAVSREVSPAPFRFPKEKGPLLLFKEYRCTLKNKCC